MSLWYCSEHGLYGGQVECPTCGTIGSIAELEEPPHYRDPAIRHDWDDLFDELRWKGVVGDVRRT